MDKKILIIMLFGMAVLPLYAASGGHDGVDWRAEWIGAPWDSEEFDRADAHPAPLFRKSCEIRGRVKSAVAHVSGLGFFEFYVNGHKMGDDVLSPNETSYGHRPGLGKCSIALDDASWRHFRVFYLDFDIKDKLRRGGNEISAVVGNGFYAIGSKRWVEPYGSPRFIAQIEITYTDGSSETIATGPDWEVAESPIVKNDLSLGEVYDARKEASPQWRKAVLRHSPEGELTLQDGPGDRVMEVLVPKSITRLDDGRFEVDFGDYVSGWVRLKNFCIPDGHEISVEFPCESDGNGEYRYVGNGGKVKSYAPRFCWWVFRKAVVSGWPGELRPSDICAEVVYSNVPENARFACSDTLINRINSIWLRTQKDNMHLGVATDCPHREKGPYTGDGQVACATLMHNFDARKFYRKWLHDMSDCQDIETGYVPNGAPWHPGCGGGVAWGAAMNIIPWEYYMRYGDRTVLEENYVPMTQQLRHMLSWRREDGTMLQQKPSGKPVYWMNLGEWCAPGRRPSDSLVHTWFLWRCADYTARAAKALGKQQDYLKYRALADDVASSFHKAFYQPETGTYGEGGSDIFALAMGVPVEYRDKVVESVKAELKANAGHLYTGIFGTALFFEVLCDNGLADEAYIAMTKRDFPGFGWWIRQGAQTTWEQWDGGNSHNHPMFGGALVWLYRKICGVQTDENEPGYRHIVLRPTVAGDLSWAEYSTEVAQKGILSVRWDLAQDGTFRYRVRIPDGSHATVYMPDGSSPVELGPGRHRLSCHVPRIR